MISLGFPLISIGFPLISMKNHQKIIDFQHILKYELEYKADFEIDLTFRLMTPKKYVAHAISMPKLIIVGIDSASQNND